MQGKVTIIIIAFVRKAAKELAKSILRIVTGQPANAWEQEAADFLRRQVQNFYNKSKLMNPGVNYG